MRYIALLRGINVGGKNSVPMVRLRECFVEAGLENVATYINSGNVIFDSPETDKVQVVRRCEEMLDREFGFPIEVVIVDVHTLKQALVQVPEWWGQAPAAKHNAVFVMPPATVAQVAAAVGEIRPESEQIFIFQDEIIFWTSPLKTFSRSRWSRIVGTPAYQDITIRNANTTRKLLALALQD